MNWLAKEATIVATLALATSAWAQVAEAPIPPLSVTQPTAPPPQPARSAQQPSPGIPTGSGAASASLPGTQARVGTQVAKSRPFRRKQRPPVMETVQHPPVTHPTHGNDSQFDYMAAQLNGREVEKLGASSPESGTAPDYMADELNRHELQAPPW